MVQGTRILVLRKQHIQSRREKIKASIKEIIIKVIQKKTLPSDNTSNNMISDQAFEKTDEGTNEDNDVIVDTDTFVVDNSEYVNVYVAVAVNSGEKCF